MSRILIVVTLVFAFTAGRAQQAFKPNPVIMVDSVQMNYNTLKLIDPQEIKSMDIPHDKKYPNGVIYITLKDHNTLQLLLKGKRLSLQDLADMHIAKEDKGKPVIYIMNGSLVTDTTDVRLLADRYYNVVVSKANEMPYFKKAFPNVLILRVSTVKAIAIRGAEEKNAGIIPGLIN